MRRREQPGLIVLPERLDRNLRERREVADLQHGFFVGSPVTGESRGFRVQPAKCMLYFYITIRFYYAHY